MDQPTEITKATNAALSTQFRLRPLNATAEPIVLPKKSNVITKASAREMVFDGRFVTWPLMREFKALKVATPNTPGRAFTQREAVPSFSVIVVMMTTTPTARSMQPMAIVTAWGRLPIALCQTEPGAAPAGLLTKKSPAMISIMTKIPVIQPVAHHNTLLVRDICALVVLL